MNFDLIEEIQVHFGVSYTSEEVKRLADILAFDSDYQRQYIFKALMDTVVYGKKPSAHDIYLVRKEIKKTRKWHLLNNRISLSEKNEWRHPHCDVLYDKLELLDESDIEAVKDFCRAVIKDWDKNHRPTWLDSEMKKAANTDYFDKILRVCKHLLSTQMQSSLEIRAAINSLALDN